MQKNAKTTDSKLLPVVPPNEALNLRAADAAAVAAAVDNLASKRRHRGPQLSARALADEPAVAGCIKETADGHLRYSSSNR